MLKRRFWVLGAGVWLLSMATADAQIGRKARTVDLGAAEAILEDQRVQALFDQYLARWVPLDPEGASALGIHDQDNLLTSYDEKTSRALGALPGNFLFKLDDDINEEKLDRMGQLRFGAFRSKLLADQKLQAARDERRVNPLLYLRTRSILATIESDNGNVYDRTRNAISRLEIWPQILQQARLHLGRPPRIWTEAAIRETDAAIAALAAVPPMAVQTYEAAPDIEPRLKAAVSGAKAALESYKVFLSTAVLPKSDGKFAVGEATFDVLLRDARGLDQDNYKLTRQAEKELKAVAKELKRAARDIDRKSKWEDVLARAVSTGVPTSDTFRSFYQHEMEASRQLFARQNAFTMPAETLLVRRAPADLRVRFPVASYQGFAPLDASREGRMSVTTPPEDDDAEEGRVLAWAHSTAMRPVHVAREAFPGRHVLHSATRRAGSLIQRASSDLVFTEGWSEYAIDLAVESGYIASAGAKLAALRARLVSAARAVADARMHCGDWTPAQAEEYLQKKAFLTATEAKAEVLRLTLQPTLGVAGFAGRRHILDLRRRLERRLDEQFSPREFHDRLLHYGRVPLPLVERHLLKDWVRK